MYEVLTPNYRRAGDVSAVDWTVIDMAEAKAKFGGAPVLQRSDP